MAQANFVHHVGMSVPSLEEARRFYIDMLGFEETAAGEFDRDPDIDRILGVKDATAKVMFLRFGDFSIEMFEFAGPAQTRLADWRSVHLHGITHFCLDVSDVRGLHARLSAAGMRFHSDPVDKAGVRTCYGRDPFGNVIELQEIITSDPVQGI